MGEILTAEEAERIQLVHQLIATQNFTTATDELIRKIAGLPTRAYEVHKLQVLPQLDMSFDRFHDALSWCSANPCHRRSRKREQRPGGNVGTRYLKVVNMNESNELLVSDDGPVRHLRFNRPERLNVIDLAQHERIIKELERAEANPDIRVITFSGGGASLLCR